MYFFWESLCNSRLWQLQNPNLQDNFAHDVLLIDEGQDLNPPMLDVFNRQETTKVIVGGK